MNKNNVLKIADECRLGALSNSGLWVGYSAEAESVIKFADILSQPAQSAVVPQWIDGAPNKPWSEEWFIAKTVYGDRVVLRALPEEYGYDFTTADKTYIKRDKIKCWMQFPDSEYIPPPSVSASQTANLTDERIVELYRDSFNAMIGRMREAPKHVPPTVLEFARSIEKEIRAALPSQSEPSIDRVTPEMRADLADMQREIAEVGEGIAALADESQSEPVSADAAQIRNAAYEQCAALCADERFVYSDEEWKIRQLLAEGILALKSSPQVAQEPAQAQVVAIPDGFIRDDLEAVAEGLESGYEKTVNVGKVQGDFDEHLESSTAYAARFIRKYLAASPVLTQPSEPERMTIDESREYLVNFMEQHFTDKTFHRYIRGERGASNLAGDFAWQIARALRLFSLSASQQASELDKLDAQLWACNQETSKEFLIKSGPLSEMMAEMERMNGQGHDYFIRSGVRAAQEKA